jgi:predicted transcriptional regulator
MVNGLDAGPVRLGIDGNMYLDRLWTRPAIKAGLAEALGGLPTTFRSEVERDINQFKQYSWYARFIFDGLDLPHFMAKDKHYKPDPAAGRRRAAWEAWTRLAEKGRYADVTERAELVTAARDAFESGIPNRPLLHVSVSLIE